MKKILLVIWFFAGIAIVLWHFGPGQAGWQRSTAAGGIKQALEYQKNGQPELAVRAYEKALAILPPEDTASRAKARIGLARARIDSRGLPEARADMESLVSELPPSSDPELLAAARTTLAETQYYNTWLLRLEGAPREEWEPEIESARQLFRNNVESAPPGDTARDQTIRNLESTIRLARLELTELQAMPLPSQCKGCQSCKGIKPGKKGQKPKPNTNDVRSAGGALDLDNTGD